MAGIGLGSDSNRLQIAFVPEVTFGDTPASPSMTLMRITGETLNADIDTIRSEEIRSDRMNPDLIQVAARNNGGFTFEASFGAQDTFYEAGFQNTFVDAPVFDNDGTPDSIITDVLDVTDTFTLSVDPTAIVANHLIRTSGFDDSANNARFKVASSTATTVVVAGTPTLTDDTAPAGTARLKVVGFQGNSGDITQTTTGLASTSLDFTTLGLSVGQWISIGGATAAEIFDTGANGFAKITTITATALTLDNIASLATDSAAGKTISVFFGDVLKIGTTPGCFSIEKVLLGQTTPAFVVYTGMVVNSFAVTAESGSILNGNFDFLGDDASVSETALDATPTAASTNEVLNAVNNASISEAGAVVTLPNFIQSFTLNLANNLREQTAVSKLGLVGIGSGDADVTGTMTTYFGDKSLLEKFLNNTASSVNFRAAKNTQALIFTVPNIKFDTAPVTADSRNIDVTVDLTFTGLLDTTTSTSLQLDRIEEFGT